MIHHLFTALLGAATLTTPQETLIENEAEFAIKLYQNSDQNENFVYSPYSIFSCLSMVLAGAKENTAYEIHKALQLSLPASSLPRLSAEIKQELPDDEVHIANALWADIDTFILSDFRHLIDTNYQGKAESLNFKDSEKAISIINEWVSNETHKKINDLLQPGDVDSSTRMVLTNAIYFSAKFQRPFDKEKTSPDDFFLSSGESKQVPMMHQMALLPYYASDEVEMVLLPFEKSHRACVILLPKEDFEPAFTTENLLSWMSSVKQTQIDLTLPSFKFSKRWDLAASLKALGMEDAFDQNANFSGIDGMRDLYLNKVVHEAFFALNEEGVTAAAATAGAFKPTAIAPKQPPIQVTINKPFVFMIVDRLSHLVLFLGKVESP